MNRKIALACVIPLLTAIPIVLELRAEEESRHSPASGSGTIEGTEIRLSSRLNARVVNVAVKRGDSVEAGALLVSLDCDDARAALVEAEARADAAAAQVAAADAQADASERTRGVLTASTDAARAQVSSLLTEQAVTSRNAGRLEQLGDDATAVSRDEMRSRAIGLSHQAQAADAQRRSLGAQVEAAQASFRAARAQAEATRKNLLAAQAGVQRARLLVGECEIRAPRAAVVDDVFVEPGEQNPANTLLVRLVDLDSVKATFYLPNAELGSARIAAPALVVADAWPGREFAARVETVSSSAEFTPRNIQTRTDRDRLVFAVEVRIDNPDHQLRPGMPVQVTLPGTER
jgi:HlyD family secretion protein